MTHTDVFTKLTRNLAIARRSLSRPLTLAEKILFGHLDDPTSAAALVPGTSDLALRPDRVVFQDVLGQSGLLQFMQTKRDKVAVPTTIHCDHLIQARTEGRADLLASLAESKEVYDFLRSAAAKYGAGFWEPGAGISTEGVSIPSVGIHASISVYASARISAKTSEQMGNAPQRQR